MSVFMSGLGRRLARKVRASLGQGTTDARSGSRSSAARPQRKDEKLAMLERENASLRAQLVKKDAPGRGAQAENVLWIFGSGRTGSSWLSFMMGELPNHARWNEPLVGYLFAHVYYERGERRTDEKYFILGDDYKESWLSSIRSLVLDGANARFPEVTENSYVIIKEPHGSRGAPFLMEALPESRMIFLVRDPRDVAASAINATYIPRRNRPQPKEARRKRVEENPDVFVRGRARSYLQDVKFTKRAYEAHKGRKVLVRYEDLRADTLSTMKHIYSTLEIPVGEEELAKAVEKYNWENIPEDQKGSSKGRRKATPGGWKEDLTPEQIEIVEREAAPILEEFYKDRKTSSRG